MPRLPRFHHVTLACCLVAAMLFCLAAPGHAAYLTDKPITITQPDGSSFDVLVSGDEYYNWVHDSSGYVIVQNVDTGEWVYGVLDNGAVVPSQYVVGTVNPETTDLVPNIKPSVSRYQTARKTLFAQPLETTPQPAPTSGTLNNIVIFIRFSDDAEYTDLTSSYETVFNNTTSGASSLRNYFYEASYNTLTVSTTLYPTQTGTTVVSYQDSHPRGYYLPYSASNTIGYTDDGGSREQAMLAAAVNAVSSQIPTDLNVDIDNNGNVDNVCFVVKGGTSAWGTVLWPHMWALYMQTVRINGKRVWNYDLQFSSWVIPNGVDVLSHEMLHSIGCPDLYHYTDGYADPVGQWDVMCATTNPPQYPSAYLKYKYLKWIPSLPVITAPGTYTLNPATSSTNNCYKIASPNSTKEFFLLEYRRETGKFETALPGTGLIVYRINTAVDGNADGPPDGVWVYRPNGTATSTGSINSAYFSSGSGRTAINDTTNPASRLSDGSPGGLKIAGVGAAGTTIQFSVLGSYTVSGKVTDSAGAGISGATVCFSSSAEAIVNRTLTATTDSAGNYTADIGNGTWYGAAYKKGYNTSSDRTFTVNGAAVTGVNFMLAVYTPPAALVALDGRDLTAGEVATWNNTGSLGGTFSSDGTAPVAQTLSGKACVTFDGTDDHLLSSFTAPAGITGAGDWSVAVWAYNPAILAEETMVSWAERGSTSQAMQFNYGSSATLGAADHYGNDLAWSGSTPPATAGWHQLVLTYNGTTEKVYVDGALNNSAAKTLNLFADQPVVLGSACDPGQVPTLFFGGSLASVRVLDTAMTATQVYAAYLNPNPVYAITSAAGTGGTISPAGTVAVESGASLTLNITPSVGYSISSVTVDGVSQGAVSTYTFTNVTANHTITASFVILPPHTITASAGAGGSISPGGAVTVLHGASQTFTVTPDAGYAVSQLVVDGTSRGALSSFTFSNVTADHTIAATFNISPMPTPVALYELENNVLDSRNSYNGTAYNAPAFVAGKIGAYAMSLNGTSQYVSIPRPVSTNFTMAFWVKTTQTSPTGTNWYNGNGLIDGEVGGVTNDFGISYLNSKVAFGVGNADTTLQSTTSINTGKWTHVACTRNSTTGEMCIYINGVLETTGTGPTGARSSATTLHFGNLQTNIKYFAGVMDQVRIYNSVLTANEVKILANEDKTYTISASAGPDGSINPSGVVTITYGGGQMFAVSPTPGFGILDVLVDGASVGAVKTYIFTGVTANHQISATFGKPYGVTNDSAQNDIKLNGKLVRIWGAVTGTSGAISFTVDDGYGTPIIVKADQLAPQSLPTAGNMVAVTGILNEDKTLQAQEVIIVPQL